MHISAMPSTKVLGYFQPSLRDEDVAHLLGAVFRRQQLANRAPIWIIRKENSSHLRIERTHATRWTFWIVRDRVAGAHAGRRFCARSPRGRQIEQRDGRG